VIAWCSPKSRIINQGLRRRLALGAAGCKPSGSDKTQTAGRNRWETRELTVFPVMSNSDSHERGDLDRAIRLYFLDNFRKNPRKLVATKQLWDPQN
jgi:hypothetical protein